RKLSAAVPDFWLGVGVDCLPICALLTEHRVPFLLYTSYALLEGAPKAPILAKPAPPARIVAAVADLFKKSVPIDDAGTCQRSHARGTFRGDTGATPLATCASAYILHQYGAEMLVDKSPTVVGACRLLLHYP